MNRVLSTGLILGGLLMSAAVLAAPIAERPPLNKLGKEAINSPYMSPQPIPDAAAVPLPAYPGSYFERIVVPGQHIKKGMYITLVLVSTDSPSKVRAWYAKHLKGMKYYSTFKAFAKPGLDGSFDKLFKTAHVMIHPTTQAKLNPPWYALPHVKTQITFGYHAK